MVQPEVGHQVPAAFPLATSRAAGKENLFRWSAGQIELFKRDSRHGRNILPTGHRFRGLAPSQTEALVREVEAKLVGKNGQGQGVETLALRAVDEVEDLDVHCR
jgi:hypothetical protein